MQTATSLALLALLCGSLLLAQVRVTHSWVAIAYYYDEAHPGKCYISDSIILSPGETAKQPDQCAQITCSNGDNGLCQITGCGAVAPPPACQWDDYVDANAPYPQCCLRKVICANAENLTAALEYQRHVSELFGINEQRADSGVAQLRTVADHIDGAQGAVESAVVVDAKSVQLLEENTI